MLSVLAEMAIDEAVLTFQNASRPMQRTEDGIRVNAVSPGVIDTQMNAHLSARDLEALREQTPLGRIGKPEDVAQALLYLAQAEFVTGQNLAVNGGFVI